MTGYPSASYSTAAMTKSEFKDWLERTSEGYRAQMERWYGKPRVRVPVERQVPNEADL